MLKQYIKYLVTVIIIVMIVCIILYKNILFASSECNSNITAYGIIDGYLSELRYDNIVYPSNNFSDEKTHGDQLVEFSNRKNFIGKIFYYPAVDSAGEITDKSIIAGLNWMSENSVDYVNISLSTKKYSDELENWISEHQDIKIYCSYNNQVNTFDYPALYATTIASGASKKINYKDIDKEYRTNRIIIYNNGWHYFKGNSFLSLNTLLNN